MTRVPDEGMLLVPGDTLITATPEEGRALAITLARHTVHTIQPDLETLRAGRARYGGDPMGLIAAAQVVALEFATIAAANDYWR
ncbi:MULTISPECIES: hexameric tyrosine-coordinated heme protein [Nonomuraea]|uniref:Hexameric tyrosine-coordinated heme protein n=1 Tax=Nonomuraea mangrovi TaxID=2316207 RepID=A0ABW4TBY4_9ACTN